MENAQLFKKIKKGLLERALKIKNRLSEIRRKSGLLCLFRYLDSLGDLIEKAFRIIPSQAGICDGFSIAVFAHLL